MVEQLRNNIDNEINIDELNDNIVGRNVSIVGGHDDHLQDDGMVLININEIRNDITYSWKIQAIVTCEYPKRTFMNTYGSGEISSWDLTDESGSINLIAFNLNSYHMFNKLKKDRAYEFTNLTVRATIDTYKTLLHPFQLVFGNGTRLQEIDLPFDIGAIPFNFTHLKDLYSVPLNSIIDVKGRVLRDYGVSTGVKNNNVWSRRDIHIDEDGVHIKLTLWNNQARMFDRNMAGLSIKLKNVKVLSYDESRMLISMANTQLLTN